jgi:hypothetical protein
MKQPGSEQILGKADSERQRYLTDLAHATDARKDRVGEHNSEHAPA